MVRVEDRHHLGQAVAWASQASRGWSPSIGAASSSKENSGRRKADLRLEPRIADLGVNRAIKSLAGRQSADGAGRDGWVEQASVDHVYAQRLGALREVVMLGGINGRPN